MILQEQAFITIFPIHKKMNREIGKVKTKYFIKIEFLHTHSQHIAETKVRFQVTHLLAKQ